MFEDYHLGFVSCTVKQCQQVELTALSYAVRCLCKQVRVVPCIYGSKSTQGEKETENKIFLTEEQQR